MFECICGSPDAVDDKILAPTGEQSAAEPAAPDPTARIEANNDAIYAEFKKALVSAQSHVIKHGTDRNGRQRVLFTDPGFKTIGWKEAGKNHKQQPLTLSQCPGVRRATDEDPDSKKGGHSYCGTEILRNSMHAQYKNKAFSLIFPDKRTLDIQVETEALCNTYVRCFELLVKEAQH